MPLLRLTLRKGRTRLLRHEIAYAVRRVLRETGAVGEDEPFHIIIEAVVDLIAEANTGGPSDYGPIVIQLHLTASLAAATKEALFRRIADCLSREFGIAADPILIDLIEMPRENRWMHPPPGVSAATRGTRTRCTMPPFP